MGHEDRERKFEQALARHLRAEGARARNEADARADVRSEPGETELCPDAGTLAAFHEGLLLNKEMNATTEHIAGCSRCQQVLLHLEATDEIPLLAESKNDLKTGDTVLSTSELHANDAGMQMQNPAVAGQSKAGSTEPRDISRGRGFKGLRWAAPAGAIAAGLLIWFVARNNKVHTPSQFDNVQVAQEQPGDEQLASRPLAAAAPPTAKAPEGKKESSESRKDNSLTRQRGAESGAARVPERYSPNAKAKGPSGSVASSNFVTRAPTTDSLANGPMGARQNSNLVVLKPPAKPETPSPNQSTAGVSASAAPIDTSSADVNLQSAAPMPPASEASSGAPANATNKKAKAAPAYTTQTIIDEVPALPTERMATAQKLHEPSLETSGKTAPGNKILAPGGTVLWRLAKGRIERSVDSGVTWAPQSSGVKIELLAGSAPSEAVCWIVGRAGTILRTTDGGGHWNQVVSPVRGDIAGVEAVDAMTAEIFDAPKTARFVTHNGGDTWEAAKEQIAP